jgi:hypothetical protein
VSCVHNTCVIHFLFSQHSAAPWWPSTAYKLLA